MKREDVYKLIDGERDYQKKWDKQAEESGSDRRDVSEPVESWLLWMRRYLDLATAEASHNVDKTRALDNVRKIVSLGVACMEYNNTRSRSEEQKEKFGPLKL